MTHDDSGWGWKSESSIRLIDPIQAERFPKSLLILAHMGFCFVFCLPVLSLILGIAYVR